VTFVGGKGRLCSAWNISHACDVVDANDSAIEISVASEKGGCQALLTP